ncbi:heat shock factor-binding protein 1-like protein 1 [Platichthys flesus]|uniref:heat shock factor-binding protein 1-like protein 1 n=1 Tax=Platichthys flesus TaxID=8260 RepID=UPI002DBF3994|nr:heat shock factor-binding protein 1-like protein 1 [Platichthys flesus]
MTGTEDKLQQRSTMSKSEIKDMTEAMEETMQRLQGRFQGIHEQLESRLTQMGTRIDDLEKNVSDLMTQAGMEEQAVSK